MDKPLSLPDPFTADSILQPESLRQLVNNIISPFSYYRVEYDALGQPVDCVFLAVNTAFEAETGWKREDILGKRLLTVSPQTEPFWIECFGRVAKTGATERCSNYARALDSWFELIAYSPKQGYVIVTTVNTTEAVNRRLMLLEKTIELNAQQDENFRLAHEDPVTRLPNRASFSAALAAFTADARAAHRHFAVAALSLDGLTELNATYGTLLGERILLAVAGLLKSCLQPGERLFCLWGPVFGLLLPDAQDERRVADRLDVFLAAVNQPLDMHNDYFRMTASCGVAIYPTHGLIEDDLMMKANVARYRVRAIGGDAYQLYRDSMGETLLRRTRIRSYLRKALDNGEFELYYQPQVNTLTGETCAYEALLRWHSPELGEVPPLTFIPIAEENRLIIPIGEWVLATACRTMAAINRQSGLKQRIAVNISAVQLMQDGFAERVLAVADGAGLDRNLLELEITESVFVDREHGSIDLLNRLHDAGVRIALDDFGTGYSSLSLVHALKLDTLKIDRTFTVMTDAPALIDMIMRMGHELGAEIVAEGVETEAQRDAIQRAGCDNMQGYLFGKPGAITPPPLPPQAGSAQADSKGGEQPTDASAKAKATRRWQG